MKQDWIPITPYYTKILEKTKLPTKLPHKLGYIPNYLQKKNKK